MHAPVRSFERPEFADNDAETRRVNLALAIAVATELLATLMLLLWVLQAA